MAVSVRPESFELVEFDTDQIRDIVEKLATEIGLGDVDITIEVDESTPLGATEVKSVEPVVLFFESGALEDLKRPRQLNPEIAASTIGRLLMRVRDRLDPAFGEVPPDSDLTLPQDSAWDCYAMGRLGRLGYSAQRQRRLYQFRTRHGFSDATDAAFDRIWRAEDLTWADLMEIVDSAKSLSG